MKEHAVIGLDFEFPHGMAFACWKLASSLGSDVLSIRLDEARRRLSILRGSRTEDAV